MDSTCYHNCLFLWLLCVYVFIFLPGQRWRVVCDCEQRELNPSQRFTKLVDLNAWRMLIFDLFYECLQIGKCVWNSIRKVHLLLFLSEVESELELICLFVEPVPAIPLNEDHIRAKILLPLSVNSNFDVRFHALWVQVASFRHVADINSHWSFATIFDFEIVPVCVTFGVCVTSDETVILVFLHFDSHIEVSTLKSWVKFMICSDNLNSLSSLLAHIPHCFLHDR